MVQLVLQSSGSFSVQIPANAIVVARVREDELSSTTAVSYEKIFLFFGSTRTDRLFFDR